jgi:hypothetical protein
VDGVAGWRGSDGAASAAFWIVGEFNTTPPVGTSVDATVIDASGATIARGSAQPSGRSALIALTASNAAPGTYTVRVRSEGSSTTSATVKLPESPQAGGVLLIRRGPSTGNKDMPTADRRFRRSEHLRVEIPSHSTATPTARLLDRNGKPLAVPVTGAVRVDPDGTRWHTAQLSLAPLAVGDYIVEIATESGGSGESGASNRTLIAFRIVL